MPPPYIFWILYLFVKFEVIPLTSCVELGEVLSNTQKAKATCWIQKPQKESTLPM
jgi:hypothetical protein